MRASRALAFTLCGWRVVTGSPFGFGIGTNDTSSILLGGRSSPSAEASTELNTSSNSYTDPSTTAAGAYVAQGLGLSSLQAKGVQNASTSTGYASTFYSSSTSTATSTSIRFTHNSSTATTSSQKPTAPLQSYSSATVSTLAALNISSFGSNASCFDQWTSYNQKHFTASMCGLWNAEWCVATKTEHANSTITPPPCSLPSIVPQCQSLWSSWVSQEVDLNNFMKAAYPVLCSSASIGGSQCGSLISSYMSYAEEFDGFSFGQVGNQRTTITTNGSQLSTYYWPSTSPLAPGCTLGCANCRVTGGTVQLIYWEPQTTYRNHTLIALSSNATGVPKTAIVDGTTLTSPTVYVSFDSLHARNSCGGLGKTYTNTIVAITNSATLSSLWGWGRYNNLAYPASFNFTDLYVSPVPYSISTSLNWCTRSIISAQAQAELTGNPNNINYTCPSMPYAPTLSIPQEVLALDPDWTSCTGGLTGVYDPPTALTVVTAEATASFASQKSSTSMARAITSQGPLPASTLVSPTPSPTARSQDPQTATSSHDETPGKASTSDFGAGAAQSTEPGSGAGTSATEAAPTDSGERSEPADSSTASIVPATEPRSTESSTREHTSSVGNGPMVSSLASTATLDPGESTYIGGMAVSAMDHSSLGTPAVIIGGSQTLSAGDETTIGSIKVSVNGQGLGVIAPASTKLVETTNAVGILSAAAATFPTGNVEPVPLQQTQLSFSYDLAVSAITVTAGSTVLTGSQLSGASGAVEIEGVTIFVDGPVATLYGGQVISAASGSAFIEKGSVASSSAFDNDPQGAAAVPIHSTNSDIGVYRIGTAVVTQVASSSGFQILAGEDFTYTVSASGQGVTIAGQTVKYSSGSLVAGTQTVPFSSIQGKDFEAQATITASGTTMTAERNPSNSDVIMIGGSTLSAGRAAVTLSNGERFSLGSAGIVEGESTIALAAGSLPIVQTDVPISGGSAEAVVTEGGTTLTAIRGPAVPNAAVLNGQTLTQGGAALTLSDGNMLSLAWNGVVVGSSTIAFSSPPGSESASGSSAFSQMHSTASSSEGETTTTRSSNGASHTVCYGTILLVVALNMVILR